MIRIQKQRLKLRAKRSLVHPGISAAMQTKIHLLPSILDILLPKSATDSIARVYQFAEIFKQAVTFLQSLMGEGRQETIKNFHAELPSEAPEQLLSLGGK